VKNLGDGETVETTESRSILLEEIPRKDIVTAIGTIEMHHCVTEISKFQFHPKGTLDF
jgi:hypothetical protein